MLDEMYRAKAGAQESTGAWHFVTLPASHPIPQSQETRVD
jgi:hypothetical protein